MLFCWITLSLKKSSGSGSGEEIANENPPAPSGRKSIVLNTKSPREIDAASPRIRTSCVGLESPIGRVNRLCRLRARGARRPSCWRGLNFFLLISVRGAGWSSGVGGERGACSCGGRRRAMGSPRCHRRPRNRTDRDSSIRCHLPYCISTNLRVGRHLGCGRADGTTDDSGHRRWWGMERIGAACDGMVTS